VSAGDTGGLQAPRSSRFPAQLLLEPPWPEDPEPDLAASQPSGLTNRRMRTRMSGGVRGGGATPPPTRFQIRPNSPAQWTQTVSCPVRPCRQVEVPLRRFRSLRSVTVMGHCLPFAWNGSWNGALDNPSAASAVSAMTSAIGAASAHGARGRTSCKRQVSGSIPLTGSQRSSVSAGCMFTFALGPAARLSWARTRADVPRVAETSRAIAYEVLIRHHHARDMTAGSSSRATVIPRPAFWPAGTRRRNPARSAATRPPQIPCWPMSQCCRDSVRQWPRTGQVAQIAIAAAASWRAGPGRR
jgi:hypothetical protein